MKRKKRKERKGRKKVDNKAEKIVFRKRGES